MYEWIHGRVEQVLRTFKSYVCLYLLLVTSPYGMYESWGSGVPTSDSDHYGPRLGHLFFCSLIINPRRPLLLPPDVRPTHETPPHPSTCALLPHGIIRPPGRPLYPSQHTKNTLSSTGSSAHFRISLDSGCSSIIVMGRLIKKTYS